MLCGQANFPGYQRYNEVQLSQRKRIRHAVDRRKDYGCIFPDRWGGHQPCRESICNHFRQPIDIVLGRESRPVSRAVFKTVGGRQTVPVGSTPTLFRHNFITLCQRKGYSSASTGMPYSSSLWSTSFKPCSFAIRSLSASISALVKQTTSPVFMLMR